MNKYDLEKRTFEFSKKLIENLKKINKTIYNEKIIRQTIASGTSIGANYREANGAESKNDFKHKIRICLKESRETEYWLKLIMVTENQNTEVFSELCSENHEFILIFGKIISSCDMQ